MRKAKGITLIALVITIIVLLILAGVAIAMLSGENGILRKAAESKTKTEEGQKEEMGSLLSYEMALNTDSGYKYQHGCITGFEYDKENKRTVETVEKLEDALPDGYKVISKRYNGLTNEDEAIEESEKATTYIATGMIIAKDGQEVARTVLFGDVTCDGIIDTMDSTLLQQYDRFFKTKATANFRDFQKIACNVYNDEEINMNDYLRILFYALKNTDDINQKENKIVPAKSIRRLYTEIQEYINSLDKSKGYSFEYDRETDTYKLKGVKKDTTVSALIADLPKSDKIKILERIDGSRVSYNEVDGSKNVMDGYYLEVEFEHEAGENGENRNIAPRFAYIEVTD